MVLLHIRQESRSPVSLTTSPGPGPSLGMDDSRQSLLLLLLPLQDAIELWQVLGAQVAY